MMEQPPLTSRLLLGALAGGAATAAMTVVMARLHDRLPREERYPLPPREIVEQVLEKQGLALSDGLVRDIAAAAHFGYGAATGALMGAAMPRAHVAGGAAAGLAVWLASYFAIWPAAADLKLASEHPPRRNALMIGAHLVWGAVTMLAFRELVHARRTMLAPGRLEDVRPRRIGRRL